jgi:restriction system protein
MRERLSAIGPKRTCRQHLRMSDLEVRQASQLTPEAWEELIAGAFKKDGYDEAILTPRSGDHGRDVIAIRRGLKAYAPNRLVPYDAVRALPGVMLGELDASKGIVTTTSDFPPLIEKDPYCELDRYHRDSEMAAD